MMPSTVSDVVDGSFPLSRQQRRIWTRAAESPDYCSQCAVLLEGSVSLEAAQAALRLVVEEEHALRTTFRAAAGGVEQNVGELLEPVWDSITLQDDATESLPEMFRARRRPFDFERGPLLRATLARMPG